MNFDELEKLFAHYKAENIVIVGLGNTCCSDDSAGLIFWEKLQQHMNFGQANYINAGCNPENHLMQIIEFDPDLVLFTDAVEDRVNDGIRIYNFDEIDDKDFSTHAYSIGFIEKFLKMNIVCDVKYLGISIQNSNVGQGISKELACKLDKFFHI